MINPVNNSDVSFKSGAGGGPWYANALTRMTRLDAFGPIIALEVIVDSGRAINAYKRGGKNEARERMIEDITGGIVWLFGVKSLNAIGDKILKKLYGGTFDVGSDKILRTPFENFIKKNGSKTFAGNPKKVALVKAAKVLASILIADSFIGLVVPKLNQKLTRILISKDKEKENIEKENKSQNTNTEAKENNPAFKGLGLAGINTFTNAIENTNIGKLLSTDAGLVSGRMYSARNGNERREIAIRDISSIYFYMFAAIHIGKLLNLAELGHTDRLNPDSANILNEYLAKLINKFGGEMSVDEFKKLVLGAEEGTIKLPENLKFETAEYSKLAKIFRGKKPPLAVAKVSDLEGHFTPEIMERIKAMSKLQPLRKGEAVVTLQQVMDAINIAEINNPELLDKVFDVFSQGAYKDEFKYISNDKLYKLKAEMEQYVKDLCKKVKNGKITEDVLNKAKNKNLIMNGVNFAAGFAVSALFLSTLIPKFQYWVTKKKTGLDEFPGTYEFNHAAETTES